MDSLATVVSHAIQVDDPYIDGMSFSGEVLDDFGNIQFFELHGVVLDHCSLRGLSFAKTSFYDCELVGCDFSNSGFEEAYFSRTRFVGCKLEGARLHKAFFRSSRIVDCMCRYANFAEATLEGTSLVGCDMRESFFNEVRLRKGARFERCDFTRADFFRTPLKGVDLSTCQIAGIGVSDTHTELRGALIAAEQAVDLVGMLGVRIHNQH